MTETKTLNDLGSNAGLDAEIAHYQTLVENAWIEVNSGNERMRSYLEAYANHRDSLIQQKAANA